MRVPPMAGTTVPAGGPTHACAPFEVPAFLSVNRFFLAPRRAPGYPLGCSNNANLFVRNVRGAGPPAAAPVARISQADLFQNLPGSWSPVWSQHNQAQWCDVMALWLLSDALWQRIATLLPPAAPKPKGGRPRASDRACVAGILFVLETGCAWNDLPVDSSPSGPTCWRRFHEWGRAGVWPRVWEEVVRSLDQQEVDELANRLPALRCRQCPGGGRPDGCGRPFSLDCR
jgi:transposase